MKLKGGDCLENLNVRRGQIWNVDLGWGEGSEQRGLKPCLVVQNDVGNEHSSTTIVIPITSRKKGFDKTHIVLKDELPKKSYILCEQIRVVDKRRLHGIVSNVGTNVLDKVGEVINEHLSFN